MNPWELLACLALSMVAALPASSAGEPAADEDGGKSEIEGAHLRIARPTNDLEGLLAFYREGLGFEVIASFKDHEGWDGIMLGHRDAPYHLEFVVQRGHEAPRAPSRDHLLVFYLPEEERWQKAVARMRDQGFEPVPPENPYWSRAGVTFEDPDGYRRLRDSDISPGCPFSTYMRFVIGFSPWMCSIDLGWSELQSADFSRGAAGFVEHSGAI